MAQLTIYIPEKLERKIRERAEREGKSLSAFVADLTREAVAPDAWSTAFLDLYGSWEGNFPEPDDPPPESRDSL
jgi:metal-responsive CopG/Arc/MetJ family transcriptional regulator